MRDLKVACVYLFLLAIGAPVVSFIIKGLLVLQAWLEGIFDSISRAEAMATVEARRLFGDSISSQILEPALAGVAIFVLIALARVWSGSWLHD